MLVYVFDHHYYYYYYYAVNIYFHDFLSQSIYTFVKMMDEDDMACTNWKWHILSIFVQTPVRSLTMTIIIIIIIIEIRKNVLTQSWWTDLIYLWNDSNARATNERNRIEYVNNILYIRYVRVLQWENEIKKKCKCTVNE